MKTILFPTDFSDSALAALKYTARFCNEMSVDKLILYNSFEIHHPEMIMLTDVLGLLPAQIDELKAEAENNFRMLDDVLLSSLDKQIAVEHISDDRPLAIAIKEISRLYQVDLIAIGLGGSTHAHHNKVGSNTLRTLQERDTSLLIIPKDTLQKKIERCMLACDLKSVAERLPVVQLKEILNKLHATLLVMNVDHKESLFPYRYILEEGALHHLLDDIKPEFYYIDHKNKVDAMINFAHEQNADLIIAIHRKKGMLEQFFHHSLTQDLAIKTSVPLLILHKTE